MQLNFDHAVFRYDPYPIGLAKPVLDEASYLALVETFPPESLMKPFGSQYAKLALNERQHPQAFYAYLETQPLWWAFHTAIKKPGFPEFIFSVLASHGIEIERGPVAAYQKTETGLAAYPRWTSRFEFSSMPADGGSIAPHTDIASKVVTLIFSMMRPGEWDPAFGGGTDMLRPLDPTQPWESYKAPLEAFEKVATYEYTPNQCILFVKMHNSWHSVGPMLGKGSPLMRRTITLNIERVP